MVVATASQQVRFDLALEEFMRSSQQVNNLSSSTQLSQRPNREVPMVTSLVAYCRSVESIQSVSRQID